MKASRRQFLKTSTALAVPVIIPASARGADGTVTPSNRIVMGTIGWGMQGPGNTQSLMGIPDVQMVAACDLDSNHLAAATASINAHYGNEDCKAYRDYRELLAREDIDAVTIAVPDHWHALISVEAAARGKDIWGEKPLARTIAEQQAIVKAVAKHKRIWQTGSWQRSVDNFQKAVDLVRGGYIGEIREVQVGLPAGHVDFAKTGDKDKVTDPPKELDYETWVGPSGMVPYIEGRVHMNWRWHYNFGGGQLLDWIGHHCDIAHWGMDMDHTGPLEVECKGDFPPKDAMWNTCTRYRASLKYPKGITMTIAGGHNDIAGGTKWIGTEGWVYVNRGAFDASNPDWKKFRVLPKEMQKADIYRGSSHFRNLVECIRSRQPTATPAEVAHRSAIPGHLCLISMLVGRKLTWDSEKEEIRDDPEASALLTRQYREGYTFPTVEA